MTGHEHETTSGKRPVRTFVRRTGRLTPGQERALDVLWPRYGLEYCAEALNCEAVFGRQAPVVLEIGFGNGETLVAQAAANPEKDFVGIEVHEPGVGHCLMHAEAAGIANLRVISRDALDVLENQVPPQSLSRLNLYFPDPWPKKRHHKRRIVQPEFLLLVHSRLVDGGRLHIATDWENYALHIDGIFDDAKQFGLVERREHSGDAPLDRPTTKFEKRGLGKGHKIFDWVFEKK